jgi:cytoskeletal protein CcmA (bactofilin family)
VSNQKHDECQAGSIGTGLTIEGQLRAEGPITVDGYIEGLVRLDGELTVGETGIIRGPVSALSIIVAGRVIGDIACSGLVELRESAHVFGNIVAGRISVSPGAQHQGNVRVIDNSLV